MKLNYLLSGWVWAALALIVLLSQLNGNEFTTVSAYNQQLPFEHQFQWNPKATLVPIDYREVKCMATAIYYESKNEPFMGKVAVAKVVENRLSQKFAGSVCDVVNQRDAKMCQFSWVCNNPKPISLQDCQECWQIASQVLIEKQYRAFMPSALFFHAEYVNPGWGLDRFIRAIGKHRFYRKS